MFELYLAFANII